MPSTSTSDPTLAAVFQRTLAMPFVSLGAFADPSLRKKLMPWARFGLLALLEGTKK